MRCFGSQGNKPGQFIWPDNVAVDLNGLLYVTDLENHRIQCLTDRGIPTLCIGNKGTGPGKFFEPNILKVVGNYIYVTDHVKVSVFTTSGQFITHFAIMCGTQMVLLLMRMVLCLCLITIAIGLWFSESV